MIVVYAGCGAGHKKAAQALSEFLNCPAVDILDFTPVFIKQLYQKGYLFITGNLSLIWAFLFELSKLPVIKTLMFLSNLIFFRDFLTFLSSLRPEIIISTHFFIPSLVSFHKGRTKLKNITFITDIGVHPVWIDKSVDMYFVATELTRQELESKGVNQNKIIVSGIPLRGGFFKPQDTSFLRKKLSLDDKESILFFSSDTGNIPFLRSVIESLKDDFNILVIYGKNKKLGDYFKRLNIPGLKSFPFYENIWELMSLALCVVSKPGGITVFEAMSLKKPLIFTHYIWGQEKSNMGFVIKNNLGFYVKTPQQLMEKIYYIKNNPERIKNKFFLCIPDARPILKDYIENIPEPQH